MRRVAMETKANLRLWQVIGLTIFMIMFIALVSNKKREMKN